MSKLSVFNIRDKIYDLAGVRNWYGGKSYGISFNNNNIIYIRIQKKNLLHTHVGSDVVILLLLRQRIHEAIPESIGTLIPLYLSDNLTLYKDKQALLTEPYITL